MSEPTKEAIEEAGSRFVTIGTSGESWASVGMDGRLTAWDEAKCNTLAQEFTNGNVTQGTAVAFLVSKIIAHVRKQARDDALEAAAVKCESFDDLHPEAVFHRVAIAIRALKTQGDAHAR